ncbi:MAG: AcrR family transcriptional regulator [Hyphomicrobiaceae bacterium]
MTFINTVNFMGFPDTQQLAEPGGKRERTKIRNRSAILTAARRIFATQGYEAATVRDIVRGTDLAVGTFYQYFRDKDDVFTAVADETLAEIRARLRTVRRDRSLTLPERIYEGYRAFFFFVVEERPLYEVLDRNIVALASDAATETQLLALQEIREDLMPDFSEDPGAKQDEDFLAAAFMGTGMTVARAMLTRDNPDPVEAANFCTRFVLAGFEEMKQPSATS